MEEPLLRKRKKYVLMKNVRHSILEPSMFGMGITETLSEQTFFQRNIKQGKSTLGISIRLDE